MVSLGFTSGQQVSRGGEGDKVPKGHGTWGGNVARIPTGPKQKAKSPALASGASLCRCPTANSHRRAVTRALVHVAHAAAVAAGHRRRFLLLRDLGHQGFGG